jgi:hypothetical protein
MGIFGSLFNSSKTMAAINAVMANHVLEHTSQTQRKHIASEVVKIISSVQKRDRLRIIEDLNERDRVTQLNFVALACDNLGINAPFKKCDWTRIKNPFATARDMPEIMIESAIVAIKRDDQTTIKWPGVSKSINFSLMLETGRFLGMEDEIHFQQEHEAVTTDFLKDAGFADWSEFNQDNIFGMLLGAESRGIQNLTVNEVLMWLPTEDPSEARKHSEQHIVDAAKKLISQGLLEESGGLGSKQCRLQLTMVGHACAWAASERRTEHIQGMWDRAVSSIIDGKDELPDISEIKPLTYADLSETEQFELIQNTRRYEVREKLGLEQLTPKPNIEIPRMTWDEAMAALNAFTEESGEANPLTTAPQIDLANIQKSRVTSEDIEAFGSEVIDLIGRVYCLVADSTLSARLESPDISESDMGHWGPDLIGRIGLIATVLVNQISEHPNLLECMKSIIDPEGSYGSDFKDLINRRLLDVHDERANKKILVSS